MPINFDALPSGPQTASGPAPDATFGEKEAAEKETVASYPAKKAAKVMLEGGERNVSFLKSGKYGESMPMAALRLFLPDGFVDELSPAMKAELTDAKGNRKTMAELRKEDEGKASEGIKVGAAPGAISKSLGRAIDFVGAAVSQPFVPPGVTGGKYLIGALGAAEASDLSGRAARGIASLGTDNPTALDVAEAGGDLAGGFMGAPLNVIRGNALAQTAKMPFTITKNAVSAFKTARQRQREGDTRDLMEIFSDDYGHLKDQSKGVIQQTVNESVAKDMTLDPDAAESLEAFKTAARKTGADPDKFNIAQQSATPSLVGTVQQMRPTTSEQVRALAETDRASREEVRKVFKSLTGKAVDPKADNVVKDLREYQKTEALRVEGLNREAQNVAMEVPALTPTEKTAQGERLYQMHEQELAAGKAEKDRLYALPNQLAKGEDTVYDLKPVISDIKDTLKDVFSQINPATVPASLRNLKGLLQRKESPEWRKVVDQMDDSTKKWFTDEFLQGEAAKEKPITYEDLQKTITSLSDDIPRNPTSTADRVQAQNLIKIQQGLEKVLQEQSSPAVIEAHNAAVRNFKDNYLPRFREGKNLSIGQRSSPAVAREDKVDPIGFIDHYIKKEPNVGQLSETNMKEFDNLFGGVKPGTKRVDEAYHELEAGLRDKYNRSVLQTGAEKFDPAKHEQFLDAYETALNRVPALRDKLQTTATKIMDLRAEADRAQEAFKIVTGSPLTAEFGKRQSDELISAALSDPRKMGRLMSSLAGGQSAKGAETSKALIKDIMARATPWKEMPGGGIEYDPARLIKLLDSGRAGEGSVGGLQVLFRGAFGKNIGDQHLDNLRAIALLTQRQALTNPRYLRPSEPFPTDVFKDVTGQTGASWLNQINATVQGRSSGLYSGAFGLGRFVNSKLKAAYAEAQQKALFDPDMAKAILELAATPATERASVSAFKKVLGGAGADTEALAKRLVEHGMLGKHIFNAGRITATVLANEKEGDKSKKEVIEDQPAINRSR